MSLDKSSQQDTFNLDMRQVQGIQNLKDPEDADNLIDQIADDEDIYDDENVIKPKFEKHGTNKIYLPDYQGTSPKAKSSRYSNSQDSANLDNIFIQESSNTVLIVDENQLNWMVTSMLLQDVNIESDRANNYIGALNKLSLKLQKIDEETSGGVSNINNLMYRLILVEYHSRAKSVDLKTFVMSINELIRIHKEMNKNSTIEMPFICLITGYDTSS